MIFIQLSYAGMALISKAAFNEGVSPLVLSAYRQAIAPIVLALFAFLLERTTHCSLSFGLFCKIFLAALCGPAASLDFYYMALLYTSATYGTVMLNTIPVGSSHIYPLCSAEIVGMFKTVGGAMLLSFYRGPPLKNPHAPSPVGNSTETSHVGDHKNLIVGPVLMFLCSVAWSLWLIMQPKLLTQYPAKLKLSTLQCLLSSVQSTVIAAAMQPNFNSWKIG
ncbi:wat1-related protein [Quercus suber]|uniref:Wat1-related protein n=1 Tax=Quercus suber TaxID=58331 RepID=A0AAW0K6X8_QUESU